MMKVGFLIASMCHAAPLLEWDSDRDAMTLGADPPIIIPHLHVACDSIPSDDSGEDLAGIVVYSVDGMPVDQMNGRHMQPGYLYVHSSERLLQEFPLETGIVHGAAFRKVLGYPRDPDSSLCVSGFARLNGEWLFNSRSMRGCARTTDQIPSLSGYASNPPVTTFDHTMTLVEQTNVRAALYNWFEFGEQNTKTRPPPGFTTKAFQSGDVKCLVKDANDNYVPFSCVNQAFQSGDKCLVKDADDKWWGATVLRAVDDDNFDVEVDGYGIRWWDVHKMHLRKLL